MTVIYADTMFFVNGVINYLLLLTTGHLSGARLYRIRLLLGSLFGASYSIAVYMPGAEFLQAVPIKIGVAVCMLLIGYGGTKRFLRLTLLFFAVSFGFGGGVLALQMLSGHSLSAPHCGVVAASGIRELILAAALCYFILSVVFRRSAQHGGSKRDLVTVRAVCDKRETKFSALLDSGNTLTDPITNAPVIVGNWEAFAPLLSPEQRMVLSESSVQNAPEALERVGPVGNGRFRVVPYRTVGIASGLLLTMRPDTVWLGEVRHSDLLLAFSPTPVSDGGGYAALVGKTETGNISSDIRKNIWKRGGQL